MSVWNKDKDNKAVKKSLSSYEEALFKKVVQEKIKEDEKARALYANDTLRHLFGIFH